MYKEFLKCLKIKMLQLKIKILELFKMSAGTLNITAEREVSKKPKGRFSTHHLFLFLHHVTCTGSVSTSHPQELLAHPTLS